MTNLLRTKIRRSELTDQQRILLGGVLVGLLSDRNPNRSAGAPHLVGAALQITGSGCRNEVNRISADWVNFMKCGRQSSVMCRRPWNCTTWQATGAAFHVQPCDLAGSEISHCFHRTRPTGMWIKTENHLLTQPDPIFAGRHSSINARGCAVNLTDGVDFPPPRLSFSGNRCGCWATSYQVDFTGDDELRRSYRLPLHDRAHSTEANPMQTPGQTADRRNCNIRNRVLAAQAGVNRLGQPHVFCPVPTPPRRIVVAGCRLSQGHLSGDGHSSCDRAGRRVLLAEADAERCAGQLSVNENLNESVGTVSDFHG